MNREVDGWINVSMGGCTSVTRQTLALANTHPMWSQHPISLSFPTVKGAPCLSPQRAVGIGGQHGGKALRAVPEASRLERPFSPSPTSQPQRPQGPTPSQPSWLQSTVALAFLAGVKGTVGESPPHHKRPGAGDSSGFRGPQT